MKKLILLLIFIPIISLSQDYGNKVDALKLCVAIKKRNFSSDTEADLALNKILSVIGASKRFVVQPCSNINNALAISVEGIRYILYDPKFMNSINYNNNSASLFVLAHEVGHHINGHTVDVVLYANDVIEKESLEEQRNQELEADEFAGFVLGKLGIPISNITSTLETSASNEDDSYSTHPNKTKRLNAVKVGYNKALKNTTINSQIQNISQTSQDYFYRAIEKENKGDEYGAIADYSKAIELTPNLSNGYYRRGIIKYDLDDYHGAIADFSETIKLKPNFTPAYSYRAYGKSVIGDYYGAIADFSKVIELKPNDGEAYYDRGVMKWVLKNISEACKDWQKAKQLGISTSKVKYINSVCN